MLFNSLSFLLFFPVVCAVWFCIPTAWTRARNLWLLLASYYFYMNWEPAYALLLLSSTIITYAASLGIAGSQRTGIRKAWLTGSLVLNLGILFLFKYYNFLVANVASVLSASGLAMELPAFSLLLPVGISFYTFQALGYSIDVYRGTTPVERDFATYALFVSFFPQLVAGPIERSTHLLPQFRQRHPLRPLHLWRGLQLMVWGYFLKLVVADRCGIYVDAVWNNLDEHNGGSYLLAAMLFPWQIYGDFAGYSLIAIGAARMMGFRLCTNFRRPYFSCSIGEFWHRWHISLSTWFKDYLYIPLGGNRVSRVRNYFNLLITFTVSGIWHGANWTFCLWGVWHGLLLCLEKCCAAIRLPFSASRTYSLLRWALTYVAVCMGWVLFRAPSLREAVRFMSEMVARWATPLFSRVEVGLCLLAVAMVVALELILEYSSRRRLLRLSNSSLMSLALALVIAFITLFGIMDSSQFLYFQF